MTGRVTLTSRQQPKTEALTKYEESIMELNQFYWVFRGSLQFTIPAMGQVEQVREIITGDVGAKLSIRASEFSGVAAPNALRTARHSFLVLSVTIFEDYITEVLENILIKTWKIDRTYKISFLPKDLPSGESESLMDFLRKKAVQATVSEVLGKAYSARFDAICNLIEGCGVSKPSLQKRLKDFATAACEARNCIVHASGRVDERARFALHSYIPDLVIGSRIDIEEPLLWEFLAALRDSARVIDVAARDILKKRKRGKRPE